MSWLIWHMARVTDRFIHLRLKNTPQIWSEDSWYKKFNMPDEPDDMGMGWTKNRFQLGRPLPKTYLWIILTKQMRQPSHTLAHYQMQT
ncbi:MAG: hypothetical protein CM1200mP27_09840 [Chloroflexota bacterium]|nr:MAG: hypothetical protein CM1200mP27_09840 [Chloroflexota bacterium]